MPKHHRYSVNSTNTATATPSPKHNLRHNLRRTIALRTLALRTLPLRTLRLLLVLPLLIITATWGQTAMAGDLTIYSTPAESVRIANKYMANNKTAQAIDEYSRALDKLLREASPNATLEAAGLTGLTGTGTGTGTSPALSANDIAVQLETYLQRSAAYQQQGNLDAAINDLSRIIDLNPEYKNALQQRATLYQTQGNFQEALTDLQRNSIMNPQSNSIAEIAKIYLEQGDYGNSIIEAQKALRLNNTPEALLTLATAMDATNNHSGALTLYKQYQDWANASPQNRKQAQNVASKIAETLLSLGDTTNGTQQGEKLVTQNKATVELIQKLLDVYKNQKDTNNSTRMENKLNEKQRNLSPKQQYNMSVAAFRRMDYTESLRLINLAIAQNNNVRAYRLLKVQNLIYMQNKTEACDEATKLCEEGYCPTITKLQNSNYCQQ